MNDLLLKARTGNIMAKTKYRKVILVPNWCPISNRLLKKSESWQPKEVFASVYPLCPATPVLKNFAKQSGVSSL